MRVVCLTVPLFPLAARLRCEPELRGESVAVLDGNGPTARVLAASRRARRAGLVAGLTLAQAQALVPRLVTRPRDDDSERSSQEALLEVAESFSPRVEDASPGLVFLDVEGCERRFRAADPERELLRALLAAADRAALPARAGLAGSKLAAQVASGLVPTPHVVPAGEEAAFLAPLPLHRLAPEIDLADTLRRWGLSAIGDFARLPAAEVASRLGDPGRELHARARGLDPRPLVARQPPPEVAEGMSLEWPIVALEPFLFLARGALDRLAERLQSLGLACLRLVVALRLEPDGWQERTIELPAPTRDVKVLLTLLRLSFEQQPPGAPVAGFTFSVQPDRPRASQTTLFGPQEIPPDRLATTLARLFALLGPDRTGAPATIDGHRPERFALLPFQPPAPPARRAPPPSGRGLLAVRVLRPPLAVRVELAEGPGGTARPAMLRATEEPEQLVPAGVGAPAPRRKPQVTGTVRVASGPWHLEEGWWGDQPVEREYWDVELAEGGVYRLYHDRQRGQWLVDGVYD
jgi:protein ImuB